MTADDRLKLALGLDVDAPPEVDYSFVARVAERIERRRLMSRLLVLGLWAGVAALIGWVLAPLFGESGAALSPAVRPLAMALLVVAMVWITSQADLQRLAMQVRRVVWLGRH